MSKLKLGLALLALAFVLNGCGKYKPEHKAGECFLLHLKGPKGEDVPSPFLLKSVSEDKKEGAMYEGIVVLGFMIPQGIKGPAKVLDAQMKQLKAEQVDCSTGQPLKK